VSTALAAIAAAALVIGVVVFVAWPFVSPDPPPPEDALSDVDRRRLAAAERRDEAYLALRDVEFDLRTGKITKEDYELERARLRAEAGAALRELDHLQFQQEPKED
jgi:hypothetical protein